MTAVAQMQVEVVYALPSEQLLCCVEVPVTCTLWQAVERSGLLDRFPEINPETHTFGVFGRRELSPEARVLIAGERVEIYRPLTIDPKEARRLRAEKRKKLLAKNASKPSR